jgi:hypothetical protein
MSKKAKAKSKGKSNKVKAGKATATRATTGAAASGGNRDVRKLIKNLDVASLRNDDITAILLHCASALNLRKAIGSPNDSRKAIGGRDTGMVRSSASYCYTKAGDSSAVSIWSGGFKVGDSTEADAKANGIPPCG